MPDDFYVDPTEPDPRFPNRPTHPDFVVLSHVAQSMDLRSSVAWQSDITGVDDDSLLYVIENRLGILARATNGRIKDTILTRALYVDAFTLGKKFAEAKMNNPEEGSHD